MHGDAEGVLDKPNVHPLYRHRSLYTLGRQFHPVGRLCYGPSPATSKPNAEVIYRQQQKLQLRLIEQYVCAELP